MLQLKPANLSFPFATPPGAGQVIDVAPGLLWARFALPFRLDHVNIYLIEDGDGYAAIDAGIGDEPTRAAWRALLAGPLRGKRLTRLIVTHFHPDHIGLAGWLCEEFGLPLLTSQTSYLGCLNISLSPGALDAKVYRDFYLRHGLDPETTARVATQGHAYLRMVTGLPPIFLRLVAGDRLSIGSRAFDVLTGDGHAPEQLMLYSAAEKILIAADQVIEKITPNVSVWAVDPDGDPLGLFVRSLRALKSDLPSDVLVLPGHRLPFVGLHERCDELIAHHEERCDMIAKAAGAAPRSVAELVPFVFTRALDPHQLSFAFSEVFAHVNYMLRRGDLFWTAPENGVARVSAA
ncbi:MAG: MBL fold metallo-hydrolase [Beijerinckiaceae bacterium]